MYPDDDDWQQHFRGTLDEILKAYDDIWEHLQFDNTLPYLKRQLQEAKTNLDTSERSRTQMNQTLAGLTRELQQAQAAAHDAHTRAQQAQAGIQHAQAGAQQAQAGAQQVQAETQRAQAQVTRLQTIINTVSLQTVMYALIFPNQQIFAEYISVMGLDASNPPQTIPDMYKRLRELLTTKVHTPTTVIHQLSILHNICITSQPPVGVQQAIIVLNPLQHQVYTSISERYNMGMIGVTVTRNTPNVIAACITTEICTLYDYLVENSHPTDILLAALMWYYLLCDNCTHNDNVTVYVQNVMSNVVQKIYPESPANIIQECMNALGRALHLTHTLFIQGVQIVNVIDHTDESRGITHYEIHDGQLRQKWPLPTMADFRDPSDSDSSDTGSGSGLLRPKLRL